MRKMTAISLFCLFVLLLASCGAESPASSLSADDVKALSNTAYGDTLEEFLANVVEADVEVCAACDQDGNVLIQYTLGKKHASAFPIETLAWMDEHGNLTHVHNHPNSDTPFSDGDLLLLTAGSPFTSAIVRARETIYHLEVGKSGWPTQEAIGTFFAQMFMPRTLEQAIADGLVEPATGEEGYYCTVKLIAAFADRFGLNFWSEPA